MVSLVEREKSEPQIPDEKGMALFAGTRRLVSFSGLRKWDQEFESRLLQRGVRSEPDSLPARRKRAASRIGSVKLIRYLVDGRL
jgi:hypothetical protein